MLRQVEARVRYNIPGMLKSNSPRNKMETMERAGRLIGKLKLSPGITDPETRARSGWALAAGKKIAANTLATAWCAERWWWKWKTSCGSGSSTRCGIFCCAICKGIGRGRW